MSKTFRVMYARQTYLQLSIDVQADTEDEAKRVAASLLEDNDDALEESPETYTSTTEPTGDVDELEDVTVEDDTNE